MKKVTKKPFLVDVPVKINIWIRCDCQKKQWEIIKLARPSILFIQSDGGRNSTEWDAINKNRKMIDESIDWECQVYKFYEDHNNGLYTMDRKVSDFIWSKVDRCIFTEDDQLMSLSFFRYCAELLEKYKDDTRIECICGMNHLGICDKVTSDYFFARQGSIWGYATWRRARYNENTFDYFDDKYLMKLLKQRTKNNPIAWKRLNAYGKDDIYEGHKAGPEFWIEFDMYSQNRLQIIPKYNMISNIGCSYDSAHSTEYDDLPKNLKKVFKMELHEMNFPMKHAEYVIPDVYYEKKRNKIMLYNYSLLRRIIHRFLTFDFGYIFRKIFKKKKHKVSFEK